MGMYVIAHAFKMAILRDGTAGRPRIRKYRGPLFCKQDGRGTWSAKSSLQQDLVKLSFSNSAGQAQCGTELNAFRWPRNLFQPILVWPVISDICSVYCEQTRERGRERESLLQGPRAHIYRWSCQSLQVSMTAERITHLSVALSIWLPASLLPAWVTEDERETLVKIQRAMSTLSIFTYEWAVARRWILQCLWDVCFELEIDTKLRKIHLFGFRGVWRLYVYRKISD